MYNEYGKAFSAFHPFGKLIFFAFMILVTVFQTHAILLASSLFLSLLTLVTLKGIRYTVGVFFKIAVPVMVLTALVNPLFNHYGVTILGYFPSGNALTLESIVYGLVMAMMMAASIIWFWALSLCMDTDEWLFLFARFLPAVSLVLSMALRFLPLFARNAGRIRDAQTGIGKYEQSGGFMKRISGGVRVFGILVTQSLENAVETADAMHAKGYGCARRTFGKRYYMTNRDQMLIGCIVVLGVCFTAGVLKGAFTAVYNPAIRISTDCLMWCYIMCFYLVGLMPAGVQIENEISWKKARLNMRKQRKGGWRLWEK